MRQNRGFVMNLVIRVRRLGFLFCFYLLGSCGGGGGGGSSAPPPVNQLPRPVINVSAESGYAPLTVEFDGSGSSDSDGSIQTYSWQMGDGNSYAGSSVSHTYNTLDTFTATLTITDDDGASASASVNIDVHAQFAGYYTGYWGSTDIDVIIGANHEVFAYDWWSFQVSYWGNLDIATDTASGELYMEVWDPNANFSYESTFGTVDVEIRALVRDVIYGQYTDFPDYEEDIGADYGPELSERPSSLEDIAGEWYWYDESGYSAMMVIDANGVLSYSDTDGWTGDGQIEVIDARLNGFTFSWNWTSPDWNGPTRGIAYVDDYWYPGEDWLMFGESWESVAGDHEQGSEIWSLGRLSSNTASGKSSSSHAQKVQSRPRPKIGKQQIQSPNKMASTRSDAVSR